MDMTVDFRGISKDLSPREKIIQAIRFGISNLADENSLRMISLWSCRGGGKTYLLNRIQEALLDHPQLIILGPWDAESVPPETLIREGVNQLDASPLDARKLVLIDNLDKYLVAEDGKDFFEVENQFIQLCLMRSDTFMVVTSQAMLKQQWANYEVRERQISYAIPSLLPLEVEELVSDWGLNEAHAFDNTLGFPQALVWLRQQPELSARELALLSEELILKDLNNTASQLALTAAPLPIFNIPIIRSIYGDERSMDVSYTEYLPDLRALMSIGLIRWDVDVSAYRFLDGTIRQILSRALRYTNLQRYIDIHNKAANYFERESRQAAYLHKSLVSAVYHQAQVNSEVAGLKSLQWIQDRFPIWVGANWQAVLDSWKNGADDPTLVQELKQLLGTPYYQEIETSILKQMEEIQ